VRKKRPDNPFQEMIELRKKFEGRNFLSDDERDKLRKKILDKAEFIDAVEVVISASVAPRCDADKEDIRNELSPAIKAARKLYGIVAMPGTIGQLYFVRHSAMIEALPKFIDDMEQRLSVSEARPRIPKRKKRTGVETVKELQRVFEAYGLKVTTNEEGLFSETAKIIFDAGNRAKTGTLHTTPRRCILEVLGTK
jgi:hypothetical protein